MRNKTKLWGKLLAFTVVIATAGNALAEDENLLEHLAARGIAYENVSEEDSGALKFVGATLDVGLDKPVALNNFTAIKAQNGYDVRFEGLEIAFAGTGLKLTLPQVEIKDWEFADKIDATVNGLSTAAFLAPFFHDKAASIRFEKPHFGGNSLVAKAKMSFNFTIGETLLEGVDSGKIASYRDKDIALSLNVDPDTINVDSEATRQLLKMEGDFVNAKIARNQAQDVHLARLMEFVFLNSDNPDGPFEQVYAAAEIEDYQINQFDGMATTKYDKITVSATRMRGAKKAPFTVFQEIFALLELADKEEGKPDDERILATVVDVFSIIKMMGEQKGSIEGISQIQNNPAIGQVKIDVARVDMHLKEAGLDVSYHDMTIDTDAVDISIGAIELKDFAHIRMIEGIEQMFKIIVKQKNEESERTFKEKEDERMVAGLRVIPRFGKFSIQDFHLKGDDNFPLKDMIGEWSFDTISFKNDYAFDEALIPTSFAFELKDLAVPVYLIKELDGVDPQVNEAFFCALGDKKFATFSMALGSEWDRQTQSLKLPNNSYNDNVTGEARMEVQLGNVPERFFSFNPMMSEAELEQISLQSLKLSYDPQGNDEKLVECMAKETGMTAQALRALAVFGLQAVVAPDEDIEKAIKPLREKLISFVQDGGKIELSVKAKDAAGVTFEMLDSPRVRDNPFDLFEFELRHQP